MASPWEYPSPPYISQMTPPCSPQASKTLQHLFQEPTGLGTVPPSSGLRKHHSSKLLSLSWLPGDSKLLEIHFFIPSFLVLVNHSHFIGPALLL